MRKKVEQNIPVKRLSYAVSVALASLISGNAALAQDVKPAPAAAPATPTREEAAAAKDEITTVLVIGARQSQQNAIARKKNAGTAQDSIIAEDVGAFPDRNIGEAISRIAGVSIARGDYGEGGAIQIRGGASEDIRIELDGQAVQVAGGTDLNGGGSGRGVELRELSSDLIKSVDVVKGSTADMTEGSLGGGVIITTRTGLDFKKPYASLRVSASQGSLNKQISPDLNLVLSNKFLDNRLGILINMTKSAASNESHSFNNGGGGGSIGYYRIMDFDNSPEKTYSYNPATVLPTATNKITYGSGATGYVGESPLSLITKSASAQSKDECMKLFPNLVGDTLNAIAPGSTRTNAVNQRGFEQQTCLNQWNDYTPSLNRNIVKRQVDKRLGGDLRLDFKVNNKLSVYGKFNRNKREVDDYFGLLSSGEIAINRANTYIDVNGVRTAAPVAPNNPDQFYAYSYGYSTNFNNGPTVTGFTSNVVPSSIKVDSKHYVTNYAIIDGGYGVEQALSRIRSTSEYMQAGGTYRDGGLKVDFLLGNAISDFSRIDLRFGVNSKLGVVNFEADQNLLFNPSYPGLTFDPNDPARYTPAVNLQTANVNAVAPAGNVITPSPLYTPAQLPKVSGTQELTIQNNKIQDSQEKSAKIDLSYRLNDKLPYLTTVMAGWRGATTSFNAWGLGGLVIKDEVGKYGQPGYQAPIILPSNRPRTKLQVCENTPGSLGPNGRPCQYGYTPSQFASDPTGLVTVSSTQYTDLIAKTLVVDPNTQFYAGAKNRPATLTNGWKTFDIDKLFAMTGVPNYNLDCIKTCVANDGNTYDQPVSRFSEKVDAAYVRADFEIDHLPFTNRSLPFGIELDGNIGYRIVKTTGTGVGVLAFSSVTQNPGTEYNPQQPSQNATTTTVRKNTAVSADNKDIMPIYNVALWAVPNKLVLRYNRAKTTRRPDLNRMLPAGTCVFDQRVAESTTTDADGSELDQKCSNGTFGNPGLKAQSNLNQNLSLEWFVNKDTMFTATVFKQEGKVGAPNKTESVSGNKIFEGSGLVDPRTGEPLDNVEFTYNRWTNADPTTRKGFETSIKTAFTFLPWKFRYTGLDINYTRVRSPGNLVPVYELESGTELPLIGEPKYSFNTSLWYDDGAFMARLALQYVAKKYVCYAPCATDSNVRNYPANGVGYNSSTLYNPGYPIFTNPERYVDGKMSYKFKNGVELFLEGRNLGLARGGRSYGDFAHLGNGNVAPISDFYAGRRIVFGVTVRTMQ